MAAQNVSARRTSSAIVALGALFALLLVTAPVIAGEPPPRPEGAASEEDAAADPQPIPIASAAVQAFKSGPASFTVPGPAAARAPLPPRAAQSLSTSSAGLRSRRVEGPAGGFVLHLGGRFQNALVATRTDAGELVIDCTVDGRHQHDPNGVNPPTASSAADAEQVSTPVAHQGENGQ